MTHSSIIDKIEKAQEKETVPEIRVGDQVVVSKVIMEGKKQRVQKFEGTVIKMKGSSSRESITVRRIVGGVGVEKTFLLHSPLVPEVRVLQRSVVRRAKLYFLRDRVGAKANRLKVKS